MIPLSSMPSLCDIDTWKRARIGTFTQFKGNLSIKGKDRNDTVMQSTRIKRQLSNKRLRQERQCYAVCTYPKGMYQLKVRTGTTLQCSLHVSKENVSIKGKDRNDTVVQSTRIERQLSNKRLRQERHCYAVCTYPKRMYQLKVRAGTTLLCSLHVSKDNYQLKGQDRNDTVMQSARIQRECTN